MQLNLHEIINVPGEQVSFECVPEISGMSFDGVVSFESPITARGTVKNRAGVLVLEAVIEASLICECARCLRKFQKHIELHAKAILADDPQDEGDPDIFPLNGDYIDVDEVILTAFVLNMEQKMLCSEDCKGLCEKCGKNLNDGPCDCKAEKDPRLAMLAQLLENE